MVLDQGTMTQLMILVKIFDQNDKPASIAKSIGITLQGVNYHLKILKKKGLLTDDNEISKEGFRFLESGLSSLRDFVSENMAKIDDVVTWETIADSTISKGDEVSIYMDGGYLHARKGEGETTGVAKNGAESGEVVAVTSISGIINVDLGAVVICVLPPVEEVTGTREIAESVKANVVSGGKIAVVGEEALCAVRNAGIVPEMEYSSLNGVFEAATRGLNSSLFISSRRFHYLLSELKDLQNKFKEISVKIKYL